MTRNTRGFTLIELMVVIAIIVLLVTLVAVSLRTVRGSTRRTVSLSALKQIMMAYRSYSDDNRGQLLPGYIGADLQDDDTDPFGNLRVTLPGGTVLNEEDAQSYVWRLAPYVDNVWEVFFTELRDEGLMAQLEAEYGDGIYGPFGGLSSILGGISERPTFGLNSIFVGGDSEHGGTDVADRHPWTGDPNVVPLAATRFTQVKNPARLIVFSAAAKANPDATDPVYDDESLGFCELRPPYLNLDLGANMWIEPQWTVAARGLVEQTPAGEYTDGAGLPIVRNGNDVIAVGLLDGSASLEQVSNLSRDMRRWSPFEVTLRETQSPPPP
ncbi:MAG: type II secretion system protein [Phycisphaerales bacterium]